MIQVAAVQMCSGENLEENLSQCKDLINQAAERGAQIVVVPENFAILGRDEQSKRQVQQSLQEPIVQDFCAQAKDLGINLILGGFPERSADPLRPYNSSIAIDDQGKIVSFYRKIHLFDVDLGSAGTITESAASSAGDETVVCELAGLPIGLSICYDLRFGALYAKLVDKGALLLTIPAAFTLQTGKDHWEVLLRARAIEFQSYVVAAAQWGQHNPRRQSFGNAMIVDPWGTVLSRCPEMPSVCVAPIDLERLHDVRQRLPALQHRRDFV